jgi:hypothetical protein
MGYLAAYNTSSFSGSLDRGNINIAISSSIFSGSTGAIRFGDISFPPSGGMIIVSDSNTQLGIASASATPLFWTVNNLTDTASVLNTINALPERVNQTRFTTTSSAYLYLVSSSKYFPILGTEPLNTIVTNGLTMYLDAGQLVSYPTTASTWYDISGNNISGSLVNSPTYNTNGAIVFDGVDDNVNCGNNTNPLLNPGPSEAWSLSATFKNSQSLPNDNAIYGIAGKRVDNGKNGYTLMLRGGNYKGVLARLSTFNGLGENLVDIIPSTNFSTILANGQYHQMVMTYGTNDTGSLYIDGVLVGQAVAPNFDFNNSNSAFKIGVGDTNNSHPFNGSINSVSFYNKALSQAEILIKTITKHL